jgi:ABC-type branched-subunit amino acid transport system substrate-binding protein
VRALALAALLLIGCATAPQSVAPTPIPSREPNTVNVSVLLDLSGDRAPNGGPQRDAMQLWLDRPPPSATLKLRVKFVDVASSMSKLLIEFRRAVVDDHADAVVVGVSVAGDDSFAQAAEVAKVPVLLTLPAPEPVSGVRGGWVFVLAPAPATIEGTIASDIVDRGIVAPMLLASDESPTANVERAALVAELGRRGIAPPTTVSVGSTDGPVRIRIAAPIAKSAVLAGAAASYGDIIRPIAPTPAAAVARIYLSYLTETADLSNLREASAYVTWPGSRSLVGGLRGGDQRPEFIQSFGDRYGQPSALAGSAYDALTLVEAAAAFAPAEIDAVRLRQRLETNTVAGVTTRYTFTPTRHVGFSPDDLTLLVWDRTRAAAVLPPARVTDR